MTLLLMLACASNVAEADIGALAAEVYLEQMWEQRALTLESGLEEARALYDEGRRDEAQATVDAVYQGSFEPELEPLIRSTLDSRRATELEYGFGLVREAMGRRDPAAVDTRMDSLIEQVKLAADELDQARAVLL
jgi:hypothetical protein